MSKILTSNHFLKLRPQFARIAFNKNDRYAESSSSSSKPLKKTFNTPHPPKDPPEDYNPSCVVHDAFDIPDFIPAAAFRPFTSKCEKLGPGADKCGCYKNPEYHSYHRYSFVTLQTEYLNLREQLRKEEANARCSNNKDNKE